MMTSMAAIDSDYADFFNDPTAYCAAQGKSFATVQAETSARYQAAFSAFQDAIAASSADITTMKAAVAAAFAIDPSYLPSDFGTYRDFTGTTKNWPIPQVVMVNWMAGIIGAGGTLTYTRDTLAIPTHMQNWMGSCSNPSFWDQGSCLSNGGTWTAGRRDYSSMTPSSSFNAYLGLMEDINIIENARYAIYSEGDRPTRGEEKANKLLFQQRMEAAADRIGGTTNGTTAISDAQKDAVIKLLMQPSMD